MEEQIVAWLREHAQKHDLKGRGVAACRERLLPEDAEEVRLYVSGARDPLRPVCRINVSELRIEFLRHALVFEEPPFETSTEKWPYILSTMIFGRQREGSLLNDGAIDDLEQCGKFFYKTELDGQWDFEWLELEPELLRDAG